jgi:hypothetical protein
MRMYHVEKYTKFQFMGLIYKVLEVIRRATSTRHGKWTCDLITKAPVVHMLHDPHELYSIVPAFGDPRQNIVCKLTVCCDSRLDRAHTDMGFVNLGRFWFGRRLVLKLELFPWMSEHAVVPGAQFIRVRHCPRNPCRDAFHSSETIFRGHAHSDFGAVRDGTGVELDRPNAIMFVPFPLCSEPNR